MYKTRDGFGFDGRFILLPIRMEPLSVALVNTACEDLSLDSSAANLSSSSAETSPDIGAASVAATADQHDRGIPFAAASCTGTTTPSARGGSDGGYTEVSATGTAQAGEPPQSPKEMAKEPRFVTNLPT